MLLEFWAWSDTTWPPSELILLPASVAPAPGTSSRLSLFSLLLRHLFFSSGGPQRPRLTTVLISPALPGWSCVREQRNLLRLDWKRNLLAGSQKAASTEGNTQQPGLIILGTRAFPRWQEFTGSLWSIALRVIQFLYKRVPLYEVQVPRREALVGPCGRVGFYAPTPSYSEAQKQRNLSWSWSRLALKLLPILGSISVSSGLQHSVLHEYSIFQGFLHSPFSLHSLWGLVEEFCGSLAVPYTLLVFAAMWLLKTCPQVLWTLVEPTWFNSRAETWNYLAL